MSTDSDLLMSADSDRRLSTALPKLVGKYAERINAYDWWRLTIKAFTSAHLESKSLLISA